MGAKETDDILLETGTNEVEIAEFEIINKGEKAKKQQFGINVAKVREIIKVPKYIKIPSYARNVLGIFKLRDKIIPLIDLAGWMNEETENIDYAKCYVIVAEFNQANFGFLIHNIKTIHRMSWDKVMPPINIDDKIKNNCITGVVNFKDRIMMMIDFEKIVADINPEISLSIQADQHIIDDLKGNEGKKILLAEDSGIVRDLIAGILEKGGYEVVHVNNGKLALEYLEAFYDEAQKDDKRLNDIISAVITDIEMPQMDGHALCKKIKTSARLKTLPIIIFSSLISEEIKKKGELIGVDAQISKPEIGNLLNILSQVLKKYEK